MRRNFVLRNDFLTGTFFKQHSLFFFFSFKYLSSEGSVFLSVTFALCLKSTFVRKLDYPL